MTAMYGLFGKPESAQLAVNSLRRAGVADAEITVISAEPFEEFDFSKRDHSLILFRLATVGGVLGLLTGLGLTIGTSRAWPIVTGGMPILAWWPFLIVIFELTMLGGILTTVVSMLIMAGLPATKRRLYDPAVSDGKILVGVPLSGGRSSDDIRRALQAGGTETVKTAEV